MSQNNNHNFKQLIENLERKSRNPLNAEQAGSLVEQSQVDSRVVVHSDVVFVLFKNDADSSSFVDFDNKANDENFDLSAITTGVNISIVSTSINDKENGTGIRSILIIGLDINFKPITEVVNLNGTTAVLTTLKFYRINQLVLYAVGSLGAADGNIKGTGSGQTWFNWVAGELSCPLHIYTTRAGYTAMFKYLFWSSSKNGDCILRQMINNFNGLPLQTHTQYIINSNTSTIESHLLFKVPEKTDLIYQIKNLTNNGQPIPVQVIVFGGLYNNQNAIHFFDK